MTTEILKYLFKILTIVLVQVLIIQNLYLSNYVVPYLYVLAIIILPFETNKIFVLLCGVIIGLSIDLFNNTSGIHASAALLTAFARYYILKYVSPRDGYDKAVKPIVYDMGLKWFIVYAGSLILIHHFYFFYLEEFRFTAFFRVLLRVILSSAATFVFCYLFQFLLYRQSNNNAK
ncbi:MAG: rod shape-determining protein MreD [Bacteroidia bacterium]|nr:rod shape-determining protein MreD [Bacteroidia bacterium]